MLLTGGVGGGSIGGMPTGDSSLPIAGSMVVGAGKDSMLAGAVCMLAGADCMLAGADCMLAGAGCMLAGADVADGSTVPVPDSAGVESAEQPAAQAAAMRKV